MILASSCRQKILKVLSHAREIRIMKLVQSTGCAYNEVERNLQILEHEDIIIYRRVGRKRVISLNYDNPKTRLLLKVLRILDTLTDSRQSCRGLDCMALHLEDRPDACNEFV
jgi:predicted transcriptional regulator